MDRCPNISKYCVTCFEAAFASSNTWAKLTPSIGDCATPLMLSGSFDAECLEDGRHHVDGVRVLHYRTCPFALMPFGQWTMNGSLTPPR